MMGIINSWFISFFSFREGKRERNGKSWWFNYFKRVTGNHIGKEIGSINCFPEFLERRKMKRKREKETMKRKQEEAKKEESFFFFGSISINLPFFLHPLPSLLFSSFLFFFLSISLFLSSSLFSLSFSFSSFPILLLSPSFSSDSQIFSVILFLFSLLSLLSMFLPAAKQDQELARKREMNEKKERRRRREILNFVEGGLQSVFSFLLLLNFSSSSLSSFTVRDRKNKKKEKQ